MADDPRWRDRLPVDDDAAGTDANGRARRRGLVDPERAGLLVAEPSGVNGQSKATTTSGLPGRGALSVESLTAYGTQPWNGQR